MASSKTTTNRGDTASPRPETAQDVLADVFSHLNTCEAMASVTAYQLFGDNSDSIGERPEYIADQLIALRGRMADLAGVLSRINHGVG
jgi:hypothetical protein